ncbi:MAG: TlyA family RNA methyltransferase [Firmicutes bacterium]|nr:TlyA family RNA methyltransferase [Bacillota bacterium]
MGISRQKATELIKNNCFYYDGKLISKPSYDITDFQREKIDIKDEQKVLAYVGRGGYKLKKAIDHFGIDVKDKVCTDIGASTGGFTDCLLKEGAKKVYAVDVGKNQLVQSLKYNTKVISLEETDIRDFNCPELSDIVCCDVSFISLEYISGSIYNILKDEGLGVLLIKPQFEVGRALIQKNGIVKDKKARLFAVKRVVASLKEKALYAKGLCTSPIKGGDGNTEYLLLVSKKGPEAYLDIEGVVKEELK